MEIYFYGKDKKLIQNISLTPRYHWQLQRNIKWHVILSFLLEDGVPQDPIESLMKERGLLPPNTRIPKFCLHFRQFMNTCPYSKPSPKPVIKNCTDLLKISNIEQADLKITVCIVGCSPNNSLSLGCVKIPKNKIAWSKPRKFVKPVSSPKCLLLHQIIKPLRHLYSTPAT